MIISFIINQQSEWIYYDSTIDCDNFLLTIVKNIDKYVCCKFFIILKYSST